MLEMGRRRCGCQWSGGGLGCACCGDGDGGLDGEHGGGRKAGPLQPMRAAAAACAVVGMVETERER